MSEQYETNRWLTIPNAITLSRILGSPVLIVLARSGRPYWLVGLTVLLVFTEWLDGFLARRTHVTSAVGARLDTVADAVFYLSLLIALIAWQPTTIANEMIWMMAAITSYAFSWLASLVKFRRLPSYHTWAAKGVWLLVGAGTICLLADLSVWPFRIAMVCVTIANVEAICITAVLSQCKVDVPTLWHARRKE